MASRRSAARCRRRTTASTRWPRRCGATSSRNAWPHPGAPSHTTWRRMPSTGCTATQKASSILRATPRGARTAATARPETGGLRPEHGERLLERAHPRVHLHRGVEAVGVGRGVATPAALTHDDGVEVHAERFADTGLDPTIRRATADHQPGAVEQPQQLRDAGPVERAGTALEKHVVLWLRRDLVREAGFWCALDAVRERWRARRDTEIRGQQDDVGTVSPADRGCIDDRHRACATRTDEGDPRVEDRPHRRAARRIGGR